MATAERIGFGGGCHWCTEAVFQHLGGVTRVAQGWIAAAPPDDAFSEAALVRFDPERVTLETLIAAHLRTHASTSAHAMRGKYRSAVYVYSDDQARRACAALAAEQVGFAEPLVTRVLQAEAFRPSPPRFRDYYRSDPERPFCRVYIEPKLDALRRGFTAEAAPHARPTPTEDPARKW